MSHEKQDNTSDIDLRNPFNLKPTARPPNRDAEFIEVAQEMNELIGLDQVKAEMAQLYHFSRVVAELKKRGLRVDGMNLHMVFSGPPGTGKTEVARKVGRMLKSVGMLRSGHVVECDRQRLVAGYVGQTAKLVTDRFDEAKGGVLFIDEAYTLMKKDPNGVLGADSFGQEAIDTLLKLMEDHRDQVVVIFAGYTNEMRQFLKSNPGLKSRIGKIVEFSSYSHDELLQIFKRMIEAKGFRFEPQALEAVDGLMQDSFNPKDEGFGNAREARGLAEALLTTHAAELSHRLSDSAALANASDADLLTIRLAAIDALARGRA